MGDKDNIFDAPCQCYVCNSSIDIEPWVNDLSIDQDAIEMNGKYNFTPTPPENKTFSISFEIDSSTTRQFVKEMERQLNKRLPRLPRKLKKKCKKTMFLEYPKHISKWMLLNVYALNTKKTWYLKKNGITKTNE